LITQIVQDELPCFRLWDARVEGRSGAQRMVVLDRSMIRTIEVMGLDPGGTEPA
jgi:hypothetical protein